MENGALYHLLLFYAAIDLMCADFLLCPLEHLKHLTRIVIANEGPFLLQ